MESEAQVETKRKPNQARKLLFLLGLILTVPLLLIAVVFPLLMAQPFETAEQIQPDQIRSLRVQILNRSAIDGGDDIPVFYADPRDYRALLQPLLDTPQVADFPNARGPWFGDYRIITKDGRRGTIRLYYLKEDANNEASQARLRFQIGTQKFEGGQAQSVIEAALRASRRGQGN